MSDAPGGELPLYAGTAPTATQTRSVERKRGGPYVLALALLALALAFAFALSSFFRSDGASDPEAAVEDLLDAIEQEDVIGALEALSPAERDVLEPAVIDLADELDRLGIVEGLDLRGVAGTDFEYDGYSLSSLQLSDEVVRVDVDGGTFSASLDPASLPLGAAVREGVDSIEADGTEETTEDISDLHFVAVEDDGGWYVSIGYSVAELARIDSGAQAPDFDGRIAPEGADSPEGAVQQLVEAGIAADPEAAIAMLDPGEMAALYDYAPLFLDEWEGVDDDYSFEVDDLDLVAEGSGDVRRVRIDSLEWSWDDEYEHNEVTFDGECLEYRTEEDGGSLFATVDEDGELVDTSDFEDDYADEEYWTRDRWCSDGYSYRNSYDDEWTHEDSMPSTDFDFAVTVVEVDGRWFVSPTRTLLDTGLDALRAVDPEDVKEWFDDEEGLCWFGCSSEFETIDEYPVALDECLDASDAVFDEALDHFGDDGDWVYDRADHLSQEDLRTCLEGLVEDGEIDQDDLDEFLFPNECYAAYTGLTLADSEDAWAAADAEVAACYEAEFPTTVYYGEPRVLGGLVLVPRDDTMIAMDPDSQETVWESDCAYADWATIFDGVDTPVTVAVCDGTYTGIEVATGTILWTDPGLSSATRERIGYGVLVHQTDELLQTIDLQTGATLWTVPDIGSATPGMDAGHVYTSTDLEITAYDPRDGTVLWRLPYGASGLRADESGLYVRMKNPHLVRKIDPTVLDQGGEADDAVLWNSESEADRLSWSDLVEANESVIIALTAREEPDQITVYDKATGERRRILDAAPGESYSVAASADGFVVTEYASGTVTLYDAGTGDQVEVLTTSASGRASARGDIIAWTEYDDATGDMRVMVVRR